MDGAYFAGMMIGGPIIAFLVSFLIGWVFLLRKGAVAKIKEQQKLSPKKKAALTSYIGKEAIIFDLVGCIFHLAIVASIVQCFKAYAITSKPDKKVGTACLLAPIAIVVNMVLAPMVSRIAFL